MRDVTEEGNVDAGVLRPIPFIRPPPATPSRFAGGDPWLAPPLLTQEPPSGRRIARTDDAVFAGLDNVGHLLLAVSGGPDSMALMLMVSRWAAAPSLSVATVDHGWRPEARAEAEMVAAQAAKLGLPHAILTCTEPKPTTRRQERARAARYGLLANHARAVGATHIVTAHHADDQAETVLFRLGRGSGLTGLAGMRRFAPLAPSLTLARPLLDLTKADLVAVCQAENCGFVEDPSNDDPAYARARLRRAASVLAALGLDMPGMIRLARRMARADEALEAETTRVESLLAPHLDDASYCIALTAGIAPEIGLRLLRRAVTHVAGEYAVRLERLEALAEAVFAARDEGRAHRGTLAGTRVTLTQDGSLHVVREAPRQRGRGTAAFGLALRAEQTSLRPN